MRTRLLPPRCKGIIADCLAGTNGRALAENRLTRYTALPEGAYVGKQDTAVEPKGKTKPEVTEASVRAIRSGKAGRLHGWRGRSHVGDESCQRGRRRSSR